MQNNLNSKEIEFLSGLLNLAPDSRHIHRYISYLSIRAQEFPNKKETKKNTKLFIYPNYISINGEKNIIAKKKSNSKRYEILEYLCKILHTEKQSPVIKHYTYKSSGEIAKALFLKDSSVVRHAMDYFENKIISFGIEPEDVILTKSRLEKGESLKGNIGYRINDKCELVDQKQK